MIKSYVKGDCGIILAYSVFLAKFKVFSGEILDMLIPQWDDKYSINNKHIDEQHKRLFAIAKKAAELLHKQVDSSEIKAMLVELFNYMKFHFRDEEEYMASINYPHLEEHREIHQDIIFKMSHLIQNIQYDFKKKLAIITREWLLEHIMKDDMKIERWHKEHKKVKLTTEGKKDSQISPIFLDEKPLESEEVAHFYRCGCRESFRVLDSVHRKIQSGSVFHCKKCKSIITFIRDEILDD